MKSAACARRSTPSGSKVPMFRWPRRRAVKSVRLCGSGKVEKGYRVGYRRCSSSPGLEVERSVDRARCLIDLTAELVRIIGLASSMM